MTGLIDVISAPDPGRYKAVAKPDSGKAGVMLADFIEYDLQHSLGSTRMVMEGLQKVKSGKEESWRNIGNAYALDIFADRAILEDMYPVVGYENILEITIELSQLEDALGKWLAALESSEIDYS